MIYLAFISLLALAKDADPPLADMVCQVGKKNLVMSREDEAKCRALGGKLRSRFAPPANQDSKNPPLRAVAPTSTQPAIPSNMQNDPGHPLMPRNYDPSQPVGQ